MKQGLSKSFLVIVGAIIFNIIFWKEKLGVNTLLFDVFICASVISLFPYSIKNNSAKWLLAGHVVTVAIVLLNNTLLSKISFITTFLLFVSFSQYQHRSVWFAAGSSIQNYFFAIPNFFRELQIKNVKLSHANGWSKSIRKLIIPVLILFVFAIIYSFANKIFSDILSDITTAIGNWLTHFFDWFSVKRLVFFLAGFFIVAGIFLRNKNSFFSNIDMKMENELLRNKTNYKRWKESAWSDVLSIIAGKNSSGMLGLKSEFTMGSVSLVLLNSLLLVVNIIDIKYVWLGFAFSKDINMADYVHQGAWTLIFSIVLAMLLLLFFFRGNLNFYKKNKWLRCGAYLWILQNSFLVFSVFKRDYFYISLYGLAYKRIGLIFFLVMVLAGLVTVFLKIYLTKTNYYLLRLNAWAAIVLLVFASAINWDESIAVYNLSRKSTIQLDVTFLLSLSDRTLPLLQDNQDVFKNDFSGKKYYFDSGLHSAAEFFEYRKKDFLAQQRSYTWLSWNAADAFTKNELIVDTPVSLLK